MCPAPADGALALAHAQLALVPVLRLLEQAGHVLGLQLAPAAHDGWQAHLVAAAAAAAATA